jgi:hypothetical protein
MASRVRVYIALFNLLPVRAPTRVMSPILDLDLQDFPTHGVWRSRSCEYAVGKYVYILLLLYFSQVQRIYPCHPRPRLRPKECEQRRNNISVAVQASPRTARGVALVALPKKERKNAARILIPTAYPIRENNRWVSGARARRSCALMS